MNLITHSASLTLTSQFIPPSGIISSKTSIVGIDLFTNLIVVYGSPGGFLSTFDNFFPNSVHLKAALFLARVFLRDTVYIKMLSEILAAVPLSVLMQI